MDSSSIICHAIIENKVILAIESYCQLLRKIINTILLRVSGGDHAVVLTNMLNRETNYHTVIINYLFYQLENPINKKYLTTCTTLSRLIATANSFSDFETLLQRNPSVFLPPNFDRLLSNILHTSLRDIQNSPPPKKKILRQIKSTFNNWSSVFDAVYNGYTVYNSVTFSHNSIWFQELRLINWLFLYLDNIINYFSEYNDDFEEMKTDSQEKKTEEEDKVNEKRLVDELKGQILLIQDRNRSVEAKHAELDVENGILKQKQTEILAGNATLKQNVAQLEVERANLLVENETMKQKLAQLEVENLAAGGNATLKQNVAELKAEKTENQTLIPKVAELKAQTVNILAENATLKQKLETQKAEKVAETAQNTSLKQKVAELRAEKAESLAENETLKQKVAELRAEKTENKQKVEQLEAKVNDLNTEKKDIVAENEKIQKQMRQLERINKDKYIEQTLIDELQRQNTNLKELLGECEVKNKRAAAEKNEIEQNLLIYKKQLWEKEVGQEDGSKVLLAAEKIQDLHKSLTQKKKTEQKLQKRISKLKRENEALKINKIYRKVKKGDDLKLLQKWHNKPPRQTAREKMIITNLKKEMDKKNKDEKKLKQNSEIKKRQEFCDYIDLEKCKNELTIVSEDCQKLRQELEEKNIQLMQCQQKIVELEKSNIYLTYPIKHENDNKDAGMEFDFQSDDTINALSATQNLLRDCRDKLRDLEQQNTTLSSQLVIENNSIQVIKEKEKTLEYFINKSKSFYLNKSYY